MLIRSQSCYRWTKWQEKNLHPLWMSYTTSPVVSTLQFSHYTDYIIHTSLAPQFPGHLFQVHHHSSPLAVTTCCRHCPLIREHWHQQTVYQSYKSYLKICLWLYQTRTSISSGSKVMCLLNMSSHYHHKHCNVTEGSSLLWCGAVLYYRRPEYSSTPLREPQISHTILQFRGVYCDTVRIQWHQKTDIHNYRKKNKGWRTKWKQS